MRNLYILAGLVSFRFSLLQVDRVNFPSGIDWEDLILWRIGYWRSILNEYFHGSKCVKALDVLYVQFVFMMHYLWTRLYILTWYPSVHPSILPSPLKHALTDFSVPIPSQRSSSLCVWFTPLPYFQLFLSVRFLILVCFDCTVSIVSIERLYWQWKRENGREKTNL